jgi:hypothetical protein
MIIKQYIDHEAIKQTLELSYTDLPYDILVDYQ